MKLSTTDPLVFPRALSTVVVNDISKLSTINASGRVSFPTFYLMCPGRTNFGAGFIPVPTFFLDIGALSLSMVLGVRSLKQYNIDPLPVFSIIDATPDLPCIIPNPLREILSLGVVSFSRTPLSIPVTGVVKLGNTKCFTTSSGINNMMW